MIDRKSSVAVVGAGAIGGVTAAFMAKEGYDVEVVCKYQDLADRIRSEGLRVFGARGDFTVSMPAVARVADLSDKKDVVFLATKATDMLAAARDLLPLLRDSSVIVSMQNGICEDALARVMGRNRVIGCVVGWGGTMHRPGELEMTSTGEFVIGNIDNEPDDRLLSVKEMLEAVLPVEISRNIMGSLYSKLIINSCITSLGAVCGLYLGEMLAVRKIRNIFVEIMREALAVAGAMGITVEVYAGKIDYYRLLSGSGFFGYLRRHGLIRMVGFKYRRLKSSMLQSLERGKPTEIDYLNGYISENGANYGVPTPVNDRIISIVKDIEAGKKSISPDNFDDPFFSPFA
ncbi:MAG: 2-dehydropantoate 2-reductase [Deltaproteobacteria bacterium]|nr:2-dehydropantoate 2-reductase [Deltaproteobacteria bacterium]MBN2686698.1 2-dehydropantoate 2-reductase [Deltaproteobacteria bacterium]